LIYVIHVINQIKSNNFIDLKIQTKVFFREIGSWTGIVFRHLVSQVILISRYYYLIQVIVASTKHVKEPLWFDSKMKYFWWPSDYSTLKRNRKTEGLTFYIENRVYCLYSEIIISHFWDRPVPIFSHVRFSFLTFETDQYLFLAMWDFQGPSLPCLV
jgi:hypothetical protein